MNINDYDALLFDWDGTLARTAELWLEETKEALSRHGIAISDEENARRLGNFNWLSTFGVAEKHVQSLADAIGEAVRRRLSEALLYDDVPRLLSALREAGKKLALVTASSPPLIDSIMQRHGIRDHFDVIVTGADVQHVKPDPEGVLLALSRLEVAPKQAVMLGDTRNDILAAQRAGIHSTLFYPDSHKALHDLSELQAYEPTFTVHAWRELIDQVQSKS